MPETVIAFNRRCGCCSTRCCTRKRQRRGRRKNATAFRSPRFDAFSRCCLLIFPAFRSLTKPFGCDCRAYEIDLFHLFDTDGSGTLSRRELRRAMAGIKPKIDKSLHHLFEGIYRQLYEDGDGEVDITEWTERLPNELRDDIRRKGAELTAVQTSVRAKGAGVATGGKISQENQRDKEQQAFFRQVKEARQWGKATKMGDIKHHLAAAHGSRTERSLLPRAVIAEGDSQPPMRWTSRESTAHTAVMGRPRVSDRDAVPTGNSLEAARQVKHNFPQ